MTDKSPDALNAGFSVLCMGAFAGGWALADIYAATLLLMLLLTAQVAVLKFRYKRVPAAALAGWLLVLLMGGLTLLLRDKNFIQLKTTIVYTLFGGALLIADFAAGKNLPRLALESFFAPPPHLWRRISVSLALFFFALAACNFFVARYLSEGAWVGIKTFGFPAATFLFTLLLLAVLWRHAKAENK